jgi:hypothetical protein
LPIFAAFANHCKTIVDKDFIHFLPLLWLTAICPENGKQYQIVVSDFGLAFGVFGLGD